MQKFYLTTIALVIAMSMSAQQAQPTFKQMMNDPAYNFYEVVEAAEAYFETHDKGKGSGWKGYQRWKAENESKYFPSGDRSQVDPAFVQKEYQLFMAETGPYTSPERSHSSGWRELGPGIVDNITSHYSPGVGRVEALWVDPNDMDLIYMGSRSGGFWLTTDEGATWINTTDTLVAAGVNCIGVSPTNPDSVLINVRNGDNGTTHGIYRSIDGGITWKLSAFNPANLGWGGLGTNDQIYRVVYHPQLPNVVFVGTSKGLFRSTDGLETWTQPLTSGHITDIEFMPSDPNRLYVYDDTWSGPYEDFVLLSSNLGQTFIASNGINGNGGQRGHISTTADCDSCVFFASSNGVWRSVDYGNSFTLLNNPDESCRGFAVSDTDADQMIYGYVDLEQSSDGGQLFSQVTDWAINSPFLGSDYVHADLRVAECVNGVFYIGTDGFICKSEDNGINWTLLNNTGEGTGIREYYAGGLSQSDWTVQMAGSQDNGTSILDATGWIEWNGGDGMEALVQPLRPDWMIGSWQFGTRNITRDAGQSRQGSGNPEGGSGNADWIAPLLMNPNHQMEIYHFGSNVYKSQSFGENDWVFVGNPNINIIKVAAIAENNDSILMVARNSAIRMSKDGGNSWSIVSGLPNFAVTDIAFDPKRDSTIIVTYNRHQDDGQKVFISHDLGNTWTNITYNLNNMPIRTVVIDHSNESNIYVGAEIGVYTMPMDGNSWTLYNPNLPNATVRDLEIQYGTNVLRAFTWGRGLWDYKLVGRVNHPAITKVEVSQFPMLPYPNTLIDQYVTAKISYNGNISSAYVLWSDSMPTLDHSIPMSNTQDSTWVSDDYIPHFDAGTDMYFKVVAIGENNDTTETYKFHYTSMQEAPEIDTTDTNVTGLNVIQSSFDQEIAVFPNPSDGRFTIDMDSFTDRVNLTVRNVEGRLVYNSQVSGPKFELDLDQEAGVYFLTLTSTAKNNPKQATIQLVIE